MIIKAISLWEPWASLVAAGMKTIETRSWPTEYRGELLICAAKTEKGIKLAEESGLIEASAVYPHRDLCVYINDEEIEMNFGYAVAIVEMYDCIKTEDVLFAYAMGEESEDKESEIKYGDYSPGRFAWVFKDIRRIKQPFEVKGRQGFFNIDMPEGIEFA